MHALSPLQNIEALLHVHGISQGSEGILSCDETQQFDTYFSVVSGLTPYLLTHDSIQYFFAQAESMRARRVCFLWEAPGAKRFALILQLSVFNKTVAEQLRAMIQAHPLGTHADIIKHPQYFNLLKKLYDQVQISLIGSESTDAWMRQIKTMLQHAYTPVHTVQVDFLSIAQTSPVDMILSAHCMSLLNTGKTEEIDASKKTADYQKHVEDSVKRTVNRFKEHAHYPAIIAAFTQLFKYTLLKQTYADLELQTNLTTIAAIESLLETERQSKIAIYQSHFVPIEKYFSYLSLTFLLKLTMLKAQPEEWLHFLDSASSFQSKQIIKWEEKWHKQHREYSAQWLPYLQHQGKRTLKFFYRNLLVEHGAEMVKIVGNALLDRMPLQAKYTSAKKWMQQRLKHFVLTSTGSTYFAQKVEIILTQDTLLKTTGAGVVLMANASLGHYALLRMIFVQWTAISLNAANHFIQIENKTATANHAYAYRLSAQTCVQLLNLAITLFEMFYTQQYRYGIYALGALVGSVSLLRLAQFLFPNLAVITGQMNAKEGMILLLLSQLGHHLGYGVTQRSVATWDKLATRELVLNYFKSLNVSDMHEINVRFPSLLEQPSLLFTDKNPIELKWQTSENDYRTTCQVHWVSESDIAIECDAPTHGPLRINRS